MQEREWVSSMDKVAQLPARERNELFADTAAAMKTVPSMTEKDFWVVWVLDKLFSHPRLKNILQFKGGTSLSKAFNLIGRFSEDIDLILDWREVTDGDPQEQRSRTQQHKFNETVNERAKVYIKGKILPEVSALLAPLCGCEIKDDGFSIGVRYPSEIKDDYLRPEILLEIGPLASWSPSAVFPIRSYAASYNPQVFVRPECLVPTILAKRTFWEKATILHQEAHRAQEQPMPLRHARHYYDLAWLARAQDIRQEALRDLALLKEVADFKQQFYSAAWAKYELAKPGSFKLLPPKTRFFELQTDYQKMQSMIFDKKISLDDIMETLGQLEKEINVLEVDA